MNLTDMTLTDLEECLYDFPKFRAKQVFEWINKGVFVEDMANVPKDIRAKLQEFTFGGAKILNNDAPFKSVVKHLWQLDDGNIVESVLMKYEHGNSLCLSSQVGCGMGCEFCASTIDGVVRNMTAGEMFFTLAVLNRIYGDKNNRGVTNIVVMGSGEPLGNMDNLVKFLSFTKTRLDISPRNITVSTCGLAEKIVELADRGINCNLALSLHAPTDEIRQRLMPVANTYTIAETMNAMEYYADKSGRRILIEYMLIKGVNDSNENALLLSKLLKKHFCHINLIPYNTVKEKDFQAPSKKTVEMFLNTLVNNGLSATVRRELGDEIDGACGQLRRKHINSK